jgi:hypothetical protein
MLIRDLDNPFGYYERYSGADVSLEPVMTAAERLAATASTMEAVEAGRRTA